MFALCFDAHSSVIYFSINMKTTCSHVMLISPIFLSSFLLLACFDLLNSFLLDSLSPPLLCSVLLPLAFTFSSLLPWFIFQALSLCAAQCKRMFTIVRPPGGETGKDMYRPLYAHGTIPWWQSLTQYWYMIDDASQQWWWWSILKLSKSSVLGERVCFVSSPNITTDWVRMCLLYIPSAHPWCLASSWVFLGFWGKDVCHNNIC